MVSSAWKATPSNAFSLSSLSVLYGDASGGLLAEHSHSDVQVSVHLRKVAGVGVEPLHVHLYPSRQPHAGSWKRGHEVVVFHLATDLLTETREEMSRGSDVELIPARGTRDRVVEGLALMVREEFQSADASKSLYLESAGHLMARHLLRKHAVFQAPEALPHSLSEKDLKALAGFVQDHSQSGFSVRELAAAIRVGPAALTRRLRRSIGLSPWQFVQEQRMARARNMLRNRSLSIAEIAVLLGFTDQSHFTTAFRRATGVTPKMFRDQSSR